jgi:hypothetical protein
VITPVTKMEVITPVTKMEVITPVTKMGAYGGDNPCIKYMYKYV